MGMESCIPSSSPSCLRVWNTGLVHHRHTAEEVREIETFPRGLPWSIHTRPHLDAASTRTKLWWKCSTMESSSSLHLITALTCRPRSIHLRRSQDSLRTRHSSSSHAQPHSPIRLPHKLVLHHGSLHGRLLRPHFLPSQRPLHNASRRATDPQLHRCISWFPHRRHRHEQDRQI